MEVKPEQRPQRKWKGSRQTGYILKGAGVKENTESLKYSYLQRGMTLISDNYK